MASASPAYFIGLMSGTSLDGVDGALATISPDAGTPLRTVATAYLPFPTELRKQLFSLQAPTPDELHREAIAANALTDVYADCVKTLLSEAGLPSDAITAIGAHGQTIRHRPECGYTWQSLNAARLAEAAAIDVIADFRSRDIAAGGQGAPLVPLFHQAVFGDREATRVIANIGGISNISILRADGSVTGFDVGPGNVLMDAWITRQLGLAYDAGGEWAASGQVHAGLLHNLLTEAFFNQPPPKSTGRDLFHAAWLDARLTGFQDLSPEDIQATLLALTAETIADAVVRHASGTDAVFVCGGGAFNTRLMDQLRATMRVKGMNSRVVSTLDLGIAPNHVEALAFAWLAWRFHMRLPGNSPATTGARGSRILGALYPA